LLFSRCYKSHALSCAYIMAQPWPKPTRTRQCPVLI
jgi:hypothetical protein